MRISEINSFDSIRYYQIDIIITKQNFNISKYSLKIKKYQIKYS